VFNKKQRADQLTDYSPATVIVSVSVLYIFILYTLPSQLNTAACWNSSVLPLYCVGTVLDVGSNCAINRFQSEFVFQSFSKIQTTPSLAVWHIYPCTFIEKKPFQHFTYLCDMTFQHFVHNFSASQLCLILVSGHLICPSACWVYNSNSISTTNNVKLQPYGCRPNAKRWKCIKGHDARNIVMQSPAEQNVTRNRLMSINPQNVAVTLHSCCWTK
jgi:hypothetical protein